ncbi:peptidoglycan/LPS O-acetylase OafA/YrhL [Microvirga lupini]|uniref:Peptidoglycan/LPS O-acetylase OafA/YrhL n=1 Tax=Microvirga lupini TaxID=420324 RepID=A0A7W4VKC8_9HYPH|nr:acyltransferase [Microvirga lupini]MBB3018716.1 peptidoglycan/LPS O-acetylase OafA/YrhL [Microvirga lupini]
MAEAGHIRSLTSLRFFAASAIVLGHGASPSFSPVRSLIVDVRPAVSFFFVLSGFILSYTYDGRMKELGYRNFFVARCARLWPIHAVTASLAIVFLVWPTTSQGGTAALARLMGNLLLIQSFTPWRDWYFSFNAVSWSISTEMAFYAAFPLLIGVIQRRWAVVAAGAAAWLAAVLAFAVMWDLPTQEVAPGLSAWSLLYISPVTRIIEFIAGMLAFVAFKSLRVAVPRVAYGSATMLEICAVLACLGAMLVCTGIGRYGTALPPQTRIWVLTCGPFIVFAGALVVFARQEGGLSHLLQTTPLVYLGEISFALYMLHQIVVRYIAGNFWQQASVHPWAFYATYWILSLVGAALLFELVEKPGRSLIRRKFSAPRGTAVPVSAA